MLNDVTFGQYYPANSFMHKLDSRAKILLTAAYIVMLFAIKNFYGFAVAFLFLAVAVIFSSVPVRSLLRSIRGIIFLIIFTAVINLFFTESGKIIWQFYFIKIRDEALIFTVFVSARLIMLVMGTTLLTLTTTPVALTDGLESLLYPLKLIKLPIHELALIMSIALKFIPTLMEETDRIIRSQKARGGDFESGNIFKRVKALLPILIPLLISAFRRADELAEAMDARCYNGSKGRTKYKKLKFTFADAVSLLFSVSFIFLVYAMNVMFTVII